MGMGLSGQTLSLGPWTTNSGLSAVVWPFPEEECKRSTISLKKAGLVYDLLEKI